MIKKAELKQIRQEAQRKGISRLCHFTQARKLPHILAETAGIYSVEWLTTNRPDLLDSNDPQRLDGYPNHISCSIEYPNTWYWPKAKERDPLFKDWVVLLIKPDVLWREKTRFCYRNCAALLGDAKEGYNAFLEMFRDEVVGAYNKSFRRTPEMLPCCPTDGQAEALVYERIGLDMIIGVAVQSRERARKELIEKVRKSTPLSKFARARWKRAEVPLRKSDITRSRGGRIHYGEPPLAMRWAGQ